MTPARPLQRLGAFVLDGLLVLFVLGLLGWLSWLLGRGHVDSALVLWLDGPFAAPTVAVLLVLAVLLCWTRLQGTPGALLMGLQLVDLNGRPPGLRLALLRLLAYLPAAGVALIGLLWVLWDRERRGWQDMLSGTRVIQVDEADKSLAQLMAEAGV